MLITSEIIAKKYAIALLNVTKEDISETMLRQLELFAIFLKKQKSVLAYLALPTLSSTAKQNLVEKITKHFGLEALLTRLIFLLMSKRRIYLLGLAIKHIIKQYQKRHAISVFFVSTSHPLQEQEKQRIIDSIAQITPHRKIQATFSVVPSLISGIKIQSDTLLWEQSINRLLQRIQQTTFQRAGL